MQIFSFFLSFCLKWIFYNFAKKKHENYQTAAYYSLLRDHI